MSFVMLRPWNSHEHLRTIEEMVLYFEACLEEGDPNLSSHALSVIARALGFPLRFNID